MNHTYRGQNIYRCEREAGAHRGRWIVQTFHLTGTPWADDECPHYQTLAEARRGIDEMAAYKAQHRWSVEPGFVFGETPATRRRPRGGVSYQHTTP